MVSCSPLDFQFPIFKVQIFKSVGALIVLRCVDDGDDGRFLIAVILVAESLTLIFVEESLWGFWGWILTAVSGS